MFLCFYYCLCFTVLLWFAEQNLSYNGYLSVASIQNVGTLIFNWNDFFKAFILFSFVTNFIERYITFLFWESFWGAPIAFQHCYFYSGCDYVPFLWRLPFYEGYLFYDNYFLWGLPSCRFQYVQITSEGQFVEKTYQPFLHRSVKLFLFELFD